MFEAVILASWTNYLFLKVHNMWNVEKKMFRTPVEDFSLKLGKNYWIYNFFQDKLRTKYFSGRTETIFEILRTPVLVWKWNFWARSQPFCTLWCRCFSWSIHRLQFWAISDPSSMLSLAVLLSVLMKLCSINSVYSSNVIITYFLDTESFIHIFAIYNKKFAKCQRIFYCSLFSFSYEMFSIADQFILKRWWVAELLFPVCHTIFPVLELLLLIACWRPIVTPAFNFYVNF